MFLLTAQFMELDLYKKYTFAMLSRSSIFHEDSIYFQSIEYINEKNTSAKNSEM